MYRNLDRRIQQLAQLHSRLLPEDEADDHSRSALLAEVRAAVQADCTDGSLAAGELLVLLDREADLLNRRALLSSLFVRRDIETDRTSN